MKPSEGFGEVASRRLRTLLEDARLKPGAGKDGLEGLSARELNDWTRFRARIRKILDEIDG